MNSLWLSTANSKNFETLYTSLNADVCIIELEYLAFPVLIIFQKLV